MVFFVWKKRQVFSAFIDLFEVFNKLPEFIRTPFGFLLFGFLFVGSSLKFS